MVGSLFWSLPPLASPLQGDQNLHTIKQLIEDEQGAELAEYGLLLGLIALAVFASVHTLGRNVSSLYPKSLGARGGVNPLPF